MKSLQTQTQTRTRKAGYGRSSILGSGTVWHL